MSFDKNFLNEQFEEINHLVTQLEADAFFIPLQTELSMRIESLQKSLSASGRFSETDLSALEKYRQNIIALKPFQWSAEKAKGLNFLAIIQNKIVAKLNRRLPLVLGNQLRSYLEPKEAIALMCTSFNNKGEGELDGRYWVEIAKKCGLSGQFWVLNAKSTVLHRFERNVFWLRRIFPVVDPHPNMFKQLEIFQRYSVANSNTVNDLLNGFFKSLSTQALETSVEDISHAIIDSKAEVTTTVSFKLMNACSEEVLKILMDKTLETRRRTILPFLLDHLISAPVSHPESVHEKLKMLLDKMSEDKKNGLACDPGLGYNVAHHLAQRAYEDEDFGPLALKFIRDNSHIAVKLEDRREAAEALALGEISQELFDTIAKSALKKENHEEKT